MFRGYLGLGMGSWEWWIIVLRLCSKVERLAFKVELIFGWELAFLGGCSFGDHPGHFGPPLPFSEHGGEVFIVGW